MAGTGSDSQVVKHNIQKKPEIRERKYSAQTELGQNNKEKYSSELSQRSTPSFKKSADGNDHF